MKRSSRARLTSCCIPCPATRQTSATLPASEMCMVRQRRAPVPSAAAAACVPLPQIHVSERCGAQCLPRACTALAADDLSSVLGVLSSHTGSTKCSTAADDLSSVLSVLALHKGSKNCPTAADEDCPAFSVFSPRTRGARSAQRLQMTCSAFSAFSHCARGARSDKQLNAVPTFPSDVHRTDAESLLPDVCPW